MKRKTSRRFWVDRKNITRDTAFLPLTKSKDSRLLVHLGSDGVKELHCPAISLSHSRFELSHTFYSSTSTTSFMPPSFSMRL